MSGLAEHLEKPMPSPRRDRLGYAAARTLEALLEAILALEYLCEGFTRNAAGKVFQAWRALTGAILALEAERLEKLLPKEQAEWLLGKALTKIPSSKLKPLSRLIEETLGYRNYGPLTDRVLNLHEYQYQGPDPAAELSRYPSREEAAYDIVYMAIRIAEIIETRLKPLLEKRGAWRAEHKEALEKLKRRTVEEGEKLHGAEDTHPRCSPRG